MPSGGSGGWEKTKAPVELHSLAVLSSSHGVTWTIFFQTPISMCDDQSGLLEMQNPACLCLAVQKLSIFQMPRGADTHPLPTV